MRLSHLDCILCHLNHSTEKRRLLLVYFYIFPLFFKKLITSCLTHSCMKKEPETRKIVSELYLMPATTVAMMMSAMPVSSYMPNVMLKRRKEKMTEETGSSAEMMLPLDGET